MLFPICLFPHHLKNRAKCMHVVTMITNQKDIYDIIIADYRLFFVCCFMLAFE